MGRKEDLLSTDSRQFYIIFQSPITLTSKLYLGKVLFQKYLQCEVLLLLIAFLQAGDKASGFLCYQQKGRVQQCSEHLLSLCRHVYLKLC